MSRPVVVVGGGLAGITAALYLADAGAEVTLLERRPRLGGATCSFPRSGAAGELMVDNGQHVFLRCCTSYLRLLDRLGVTNDVYLQPRLDVPVARPDGTRGRLRRTSLPAPLHVAGALARYGLLTPVERARAARAVLAMRRLDPDDAALDATTFGAWLSGRHQSAAAVDALWGLVTTATLNTTVDEASLKLATKVFQTGLLADSAAADIGWSRVPLQQLHGEAALRALETAGAQVVRNARVRAVHTTATGHEVVTDDAVYDAAGVVLAVPHDALADVVPAELREEFRGVERLGTSPIVNVHVVYDRRVLETPLLAGVDTPVQWVFDRTAPGAGLGLGNAEGRQYLAVSLSAADELIDRPAAEVLDLILPELARLLPAARTAQVVDAFVTRERTATFRQSAGTHALRAKTLTRLPSLVLAGAWTDTGWPATMEGAVRSGEAAARALSTVVLPSQRMSEEVPA